MVTRNNYFVEYSWSVPNFEFKGDKLRRRYWATGPIDAINQFHRNMQHDCERDGNDRNKILRPRLLPGEYELHRVFLQYEDNNLQLIQSDFDLPNSANPNLRKPKQPKQVTPEFKFS